jgi:hypothetical protein
VDPGTDHGGNSFVQVNVGVEMSLSKNNSFHRASKYAKHYDKATVLNPFWDNWFIQAGVGMSLQNVYGKDFTNVFPRGNTIGVNFGFGKWFSPEMGLRLGANWQNSIIRNNNAYYLSAMDDPDGNNMDKRGFASIYGDLFFNLHNLFAGYDKNRKWNAIVFPRMGIGTNFSSSYSEDIYLGYPENEHQHQTGHGTVNYHMPEVGEYYILMITNYSNQPCNITFTKTEGVGETDCDIVIHTDIIGCDHCPVELELDV